ncbi:MAG: hypothetical protein ACFE9L_02360 [Candidatus Hodarchaeota archaeon]
MISITSHSKRRNSIQVILLILFIFLPTSLHGSDFFHEEKYPLMHTDWIAPESNNIYYLEDLEAIVMKRGIIGG